jgi:hypothetical protein
LLLLIDFVKRVGDWFETGVDELVKTSVVEGGDGGPAAWLLGLAKFLIFIWVGGKFESNIFILISGSGN